MSSATQPKPIIFVIGGPGSGKGTICDQLERKYHLTHLSTGDILRAEVASGSERGRLLNEVMRLGQLVSNQQMLDILASAIRQQEHSATNRGFLIDGFPRDVLQAIEFEQQIRPCAIVLYLECSDAEMTRRLLNRGKTSGRVDDNADTIKRRLDIFHSHTKPILEHLKAKLVTVNGEQQLEKVFRDTEHVLQKLLTN